MGMRSLKVRYVDLLKAFMDWIKHPDNGLLSLAMPLVELGFKRSVNDYSLFTLTRDSYFIIIPIYTDDVIITRTFVKNIDYVKSFIQASFKWKTLGTLNISLV